VLKSFGALIVLLTIYHSSSGFCFRKEIPCAVCLILRNREPGEKNPVTIQQNRAAQQPITPRNHILRQLPPADFERLLPDLEAVDLQHGATIHRPDELITHLYFPDAAMISIVTLTAEGQSVEAGVIGREGLTGFNVLMGFDSMPNENIVQLPGGGWRIPTAAATREFKLGGAFHDSSLRFIHAVLQQIGQTALCNRIHSNEERLSRWLLMCRDRSVSDELKLTQEFLAIMLGANRSSVTLSAVALQSAGYIKYKRGLITITDRAGLEDFACDCYRAVKKEYDRLSAKRNFI
jgi:CRP-like cAMP-binding protein